MSDMVPSNELLARESFVDWDELSGLDKVVTIYQVGANTVVVETCDGREVKITAWFDRRKGEYVADFERRSNVSSGGKAVAGLGAYDRIRALARPTISSVASRPRFSPSIASSSTDDAIRRRRRSQTGSASCGAVLS